MREQNPRSTSGLSAVYNRGEKRSLFLAADQWTVAFFVFVIPFHARHVRESMYQCLCIRNRLEISIEIAIPHHPILCKMADAPVLESSIPKHALHEKSCRDKYATVHWPAAKQKSASRPADNPRINRWSNMGYVPPSVWMGFPLFVLPKRGPRRVAFDSPERQRTVLSWANRSVGVPLCSAPAIPAIPPCAQPRPDPPVVCPGFGFDKWPTLLFWSQAKVSGRGNAKSLAMVRNMRARGFDKATIR